MRIGTKEGIQGYPSFPDNFLEKSKITTFLLSEVKEEVKEFKKEFEKRGEAVEKKLEEIEQQLKKESSTKPSKIMKLHCY